jgi:hypothetical protein
VRQRDAQHHCLSFPNDRRNRDAVRYIHPYRDSTAHGDTTTTDANTDFDSGTHTSTDANARADLARTDARHGLAHRDGPVSTRHGR